MPPEVKGKWKAVFKEVTALNNVQFERCLVPCNAIGKPSCLKTSGTKETVYSSSGVTSCRDWKPPRKYYSWKVLINVWMSMLLDWQLCVTWMDSRWESKLQTLRFLKCWWDSIECKALRLVALPNNTEHCWWLNKRHFSDWNECEVV